MTLPQSLVDPRVLRVRPLRHGHARQRAPITPTAVVRRPASPAIDTRRGERPRHDHARRRPQRGEPRPGDPPERRGVHARQLVPRRRPGDGRHRRARLPIRHRWRGVQPTEGADYTAVNLRSATPVPEVGGTTKVASFNVLNYFTTLDSRGANDQAEFDRQEAKIVTAIAADRRRHRRPHRDREQRRHRGRRARRRPQRARRSRYYDFISTGELGTDVITTAFIYKPAEVAPTGAHAVLDSSVDPDFDTDVQPAGAGADVHRPRGRGRGHGRREPPQVEGLRLQRGGRPRHRRRFRQLQHHAHEGGRARSPTGWRRTRPAREPATSSSSAT